MAKKVTNKAKTVTDKPKSAITKPKKDIVVKTDLSFEQLLNMAANTPIKKKK